MGERLAEARRRKGWRQEDVVAEARDWGIPWTRAVVANIEGGRRELSAGEIVLLPLIYEIDLPDLLCPDGDILELLPAVHVDCANWKRLLAAVTGFGSKKDSHMTSQVGNRLIIDPLPGQITESELRVARELNVMPGFVADAAQVLYGHGVTEERDRLVREALAASGEQDPPAERLQALRGHAMRRVVEQVRESNFAGLPDETEGVTQ